MKAVNDVTLVKKDLYKIRKKQSVVNTILVVLVLFALLISVMAVGVNLAKEPEKGETGEIGASGPAGKDGEDGKDAVFEYEINGTYIRFKNNTDPWSNWLNIKGDKGETGEAGANGGSGSAGRDCIPNKKPVISLKDINGSRISKCTEFSFWLNVSVDDPENDDLQIDFYFSEEVNGSWIHHSTFFGSDDIYGVTKTFHYSFTVLHKSLYWCVRVWDGSDISLGYFDVVV